MNVDETERFIRKYRKFYIKKNSSDDNELDYAGCGISRDVKPVSEEYEKYIIQKIHDGVYDAEALAWKSGKGEWVDNNFAYKLPFPERCTIEGRDIQLDRESLPLSVDEFNDFLNVRQREFPVNIDNYNLTCCIGRKDLFIYIKNHYDLYNFGSVNIINMMFFLSKGAIPIYDRFAHAGVKALLMNRSPYEVFVAGAPSKNEHKVVHTENGETTYYPAVNALEEYMWMLEKVFPSEIKKNGNIMFISRELDQALWAYGHACNKFDEHEHI